jgi:hypothetical protein
MSFLQRMGFTYSGSQVSEVKASRFMFLNSLSAPSSAVSYQPRRAYTTSTTRNQSRIDALGASDEDSVDPREIDGLLSEMAQMSGRWQLYRRFLYSRLSNADEDDLSSQASTDSPLITSKALPANGLQSTTLDENLPAPVDQPTPELDFVETSGFGQALSEKLLSVYEPLELWYLRTSIEKVGPSFFQSSPQLNECYCVQGTSTRRGRFFDYALSVVFAGRHVLHPQKSPFPRHLYFVFFHGCLAFKKCSNDSGKRLCRYPEKEDGGGVYPSTTDEEGR